MLYCNQIGETMEKWEDVKKDLLKNKKIALEYEKLKPRYQLISDLIRARIRKGLTQEEIAKKMHTKQSSIARVESGESNFSMEFLEKMTAAMGAELKIKVK